ncbi:MAG TPA: pseudouridine synthase, partial [Candidatus Dormibacteraeota bacterium]|nr:pseudouridine synthase [Candidatus Dormibacteraeota bacterium]
SRVRARLRGTGRRVSAVGAEAVRLNRYLAMCGVAARRKADELIAAGRVTVNGEPTPPGGRLVTPGLDRVELDGHLVESAAAHRYFAVNKPVGYLSAVSDKTRRPLVTQLVPRADREAGVHPVGRLDLRSHGLIILTDDGELSFRLQHPRHHVEKEYRVEVRGELTEAALDTLRAGVKLDEGTTSPAVFEVLARGARRVVVRVVLRQGWKRQLRRSFAEVETTVLDLKRTRVGPLDLGDLPEGKSRRLSDGEVAALRAAVDLAP